MPVVIVVNPIYVHQSLLTTSGFSLVELTCQSVRQAIPTRRVRFLSVRWVLRNCQRSFPHGVLQLQRPWVILPTCKWRPREQSRLSQGRAVREDGVAPTWHCLQDRGSRNCADALQSAPAGPPSAPGQRCRAPAYHLLGSLLWGTCTCSHSG